MMGKRSIKSTPSHPRATCTGNERTDFVKVATGPLDAAAQNHTHTQSQNDVRAGSENGD